MCATSWLWVAATFCLYLILDEAGSSRKACVRPVIKPYAHSSVGAFGHRSVFIPSSPWHLRVRSISEVINFFIWTRPTGIEIACLEARGLGYRRHHLMENTIRTTSVSSLGNGYSMSNTSS